MLWKTKQEIDGLSGRISRKQSRDKEDLRSISKTKSISVHNTDKINHKTDISIKNTSEKSHIFINNEKKLITSRNSNKKMTNPGQQIPYKSHQFSNTEMANKISTKLRSSKKNNFMTTDKLVKSKERRPSKTTAGSIRLNDMSTSFDNGYLREGSEFNTVVDQP